MNDTNQPTPPNVPENQKHCHASGHICRCNQPGDDLKGYGYFSLFIGVFLILYMPRFFKWVSHEIFGTYFGPYMLNGVEVPYTQTPDFWPDFGPAIFAVATIAEGVAMILKPRKGILLSAGAVMGLATLFNAGFFIYSFFKGATMHVSFLAAAFGIFSTLTIFKASSALNVSPKKCGQDSQCGCR